MADDAELAFLEAQKDEYDPSAGYNMNDAPSGQDEYDPAATYSPHSYQSASMPPESGANSPPAADTEGENGLQPQPTQTSAEDSAAPQSSYIVHKIRLPHLSLLLSLSMSLLPLLLLFLTAVRLLQTLLSQVLQTS